MSEAVSPVENPTDPLPLTGERTVPGIAEENYWFRRHEIAYVRMLEQCAGKVVLEAGSGEGYGANMIAGVAARVTGLDYDDSAVAHVRAKYPRVEMVQGNLADLPLDDASVDIVVNFQVIEHLWDQAQFLRECLRVLRPGGRLGLVWNTRDERLGWVRELGRIIGSDGDGRTRVTLPEPFTDLAHHQVEWTSYLTPQALIDLVASRSYCITSPTEVRTQTLDQVRQLLATHPALANSTGLALPYVTMCTRATLAG